MADDFKVGRLRWRMDVCLRSQVPNSTTGINETSYVIQTVWADIQPIGTMTFWNGVQVDAPITHRIICRFLDFLDNTHCLIRVTAIPGGLNRQEIYRVRRVKDRDGRKRFSEIEAELEGASWG